MHPLLCTAAHAIDGLHSRPLADAETILIRLFNELIV
jgi:hypothetical protein